MMTPRDFTPELPDSRVVAGHFLAPRQFQVRFAPDRDIQLQNVSDSAKDFRLLRVIMGWSIGANLDADCPLGRLMRMERVAPQGAKARFRTIQIVVKATSSLKGGCERTGWGTVMQRRALSGCRWAGRIFSARSSDRVIA